MTKKVIKTTIIIVCIFILVRRARLPVKYADIVIKQADYFQLEPALVFAIIKSESSFNPNAVSRSGAKGLMQIMDKTGVWAAKECNIEGFEKDFLFTPEVNIHIGCWYLSKLINQYDGDLELALAAYNAGTGNIHKWRNNKQYSKDGISLDYIPFEETRKYVTRVSVNFKLYKHLYWDVDTYAY